MKYAKAGILAASLALAAGGALAQASASGSAGTTGKVVGGTGDSTVTATSIAPADGSNARMEQPGYEGMYNSLDDVRSSRAWLADAYAVPYHVDTQVMGNTSARITHYYVGVPADVRDHDDFQRHLSLR